MMGNHLPLRGVCLAITQIEECQTCLIQTISTATGSNVHALTAKLSSNGQAAQWELSSADLSLPLFSSSGCSRVAATGETPPPRQQPMIRTSRSSKTHRPHSLLHLQTRRCPTPQRLTPQHRTQRHLPMLLPLTRTQPRLRLALHGPRAAPVQCHNVLAPPRAGDGTSAPTSPFA